MARTAAFPFWQNADAARRRMPCQNNVTAPDGAMDLWRGVLETCCHGRDGRVAWRPKPLGRCGQIRLLARGGRSMAASPARLSAVTQRGGVRRPGPVRRVGGRGRDLASQLAGARDFPGPGGRS